MSGSDFEARLQADIDRHRACSGHDWQRRSGKFQGVTEDQCRKCGMLRPSPGIPSDFARGMGWLNGIVNREQEPYADPQARPDGGGNDVQD